MTNKQSIISNLIYTYSFRYNCATVFLFCLIFLFLFFLVTWAYLKFTCVSLDINNFFHITFWVFTNFNFINRFSLILHDFFILLYFFTTVFISNSLCKICYVKYIITNTTSFPDYFSIWEDRSAFISREKLF